MLNAENKISKVKETLNEGIAFLEAHGSAPQQNKDPSRADEDRLALRVWKVFNSSLKQMSPDTVTPEMHAHSERLLAAQKNQAAGPQKRQASGAIRRQQRHIQARYEEWCSSHNEPMGGSFRLQHHSHVGSSVRGANPFPGFSNFHHFCFANSVVQCLLHCHGVREHLADEPPAGEAPIRLALARLANSYLRGAEVAELGKRVPFDVIVPYKMAEAVSQAEERDFVRGRQHDAAELLALVLEESGLDKKCFSANAVNSMNEVVLFDPLHDCTDSDRTSFLSP